MVFLNNSMWIREKYFALTGDCNQKDCNQKE